MFGRAVIKSFQNLKSKLILPIKHIFIPKQYKFIDLPPQNALNYKSLPMQQWKHIKDEQSQYQSIKLFILFLCTFWLGQWIYTLKYNQNVIYYYYVNYPIFMKIFQANLKDVQNTIGPYVDIIPKERYQVNLVWDKLWALIMNTDQRKRIKMEELQMLKAQLQRMKP